MPAKKKNKIAKNEAINLPVPMEQIPGLEGIDQEMLVIPRVKVVQAMSIEATQGIPQGSLVNSISKSILAEREKPLVFVPLMVSKSRILFKPMADGGGLLCRSNDGYEGVGEPGGSCVACPLKNWEKDENNKQTPPKCAEVINIAVMPMGVEESMPLILSFSKTSFPTGKMLVNMMAIKRVSPWNFQYSVQTSYITDSKGSYFVLKVAPAGKAPEELAEAMKSFYDELKQTDYEVHRDPEEMKKEAEIAMEQEKQEQSHEQAEDDEMPF